MPRTNWVLIGAIVFAHVLIMVPWLRLLRRNLRRQNQLRNRIEKLHSGRPQLFTDISAAIAAALGASISDVKIASYQSVVTAIVNKKKLPRPTRRALLKAMDCYYKASKSCSHAEKTLRRRLPLCSIVRTAGGQTKHALEQTQMARRSLRRVSQNHFSSFEKERKQ